MDSNDFKAGIEDGIPVPKRRERVKYLVLDSLEPGQSVLIDVPTVNRLSTVIAYRQARDGKRFTCRKERGGVRVWRVL
jgi:hypothetical protein